MEEEEEEMDTEAEAAEQQMMMGHDDDPADDDDDDGDDSFRVDHLFTTPRFPTTTTPRRDPQSVREALSARLSGKFTQEEFDYFSECQSRHTPIDHR